MTVYVEKQQRQQKPAIASEHSGIWARWTQAVLVFVRHLFNDAPGRFPAHHQYKRIDFFFIEIKEMLWADRKIKAKKKINSSVYETSDQ